MNTTTTPRGTRGRGTFRFLCVAALALAPRLVAAAPLPQFLAPAPPFPLVTAQSIEQEPVAPGVARATYRLLTTAGPLVVSIVTVDPHAPAVRLGAVLANDTVVSKDEPVSSMAHRTGAVAGINGDYFDIAATGAPVGVLIRGGFLDRSPSARVALTVTRAGDVRFEPYAFSGTVTFGAIDVPLTGVDVWPPEGGASLLQPSFGSPPAMAGITVLSLASATPASYRVTAVTAVPPYPAAGLRLAYGAAAQAFGPLPNVGDGVEITYQTNPPLATVAAAIGGGPLLLNGGAAVDDPASPNYADRARRIPASAAARFADGTLALVVVDGRHPATSIGVNRAELIALLGGLGATDAMLFDSGGSATLAARVLGDAAASVVNEPSDGVERPVADGLFVYSDAAVGPPDRLIVRPSPILAVSGATVPLQARLVDAADHGLGDARGAWTIDAPADVARIDAGDVLHAGTKIGARTLHLGRGGVRAAVGFEIVESVARLQIGPVRVNPNPHAAVRLTVAAFDLHDRPVAIAGTARWSATGATIDPGGLLIAGDADAQVKVAAGGVSAVMRIPVGRHDVPVALFDDLHGGAWTFSSVPPSGQGSVAVEGGRLELGYDPRTERAAYANLASDVTLGDPAALSCAVDGDGSGAALRATFVDRYGDRQTVAFAHALDARQPARVALVVPRALAPPIALHAFSVLATPSAQTPGTVAIRDCVASLPGTQAP
ncbi:MAG TPA: phosphodiester glycosidase family protein [Candidatus Elarobacter sp.]